jgi:hypothetical protein
MNAKLKVVANVTSRQTGSLIIYSNVSVDNPGNKYYNCQWWDIKMIVVWGCSFHSEETITSCWNQEPD